VPKLCGADVELGNFVLGLDRPSGTGAMASQALLRKIEGVSAATRIYGGRWDGGNIWTDGGSWGGNVGYSYDLQDWGRKYLAGNGGCVYIDLDHLELAIPEVLSAWDHVAATHAMLRIARGALEQANQKMSDGLSIQVLVNNSDGLSNSYGSHFNCLITRETWNNLFHHKLHQLLFLASYQVSSIVFTGQGKVGSENGRPETFYQLSQRADFFETLMGPQTTYTRPIVNSRDEALCGSRPYGASSDSSAADLARLHCIFFDNTLCHVASLLKVGVTQIILAMIEAGVTKLDLLLDDPVSTVVHWSHGADLQSRSRLVSGEEVTAVELQRRFLEEARACAERGVLDTVPRYGEILDLWEDTLRKLQAGDLPSLVGRLDWVLKLHVIERSLEQHGDLDWGSPEIKYLDLLYGNLDPVEGLYWHYEHSGVVERVVGEEEINRFVHDPPEDTRAWTRAMLLRVLGDGQVSQIDWDGMTVRLGRENAGAEVIRVRLDDPLAFTRSENQEIFRGSRSLEEILGELTNAPGEGGHELIAAGRPS
jgi:proteasome accessory factor A